MTASINPRTPIRTRSQSRNRGIRLI
jgi:hypothetical protein